MIISESDHTGQRFKKIDKSLYKSSMRNFQFYMKLCKTKQVYLSINFKFAYK